MHVISRKTLQTFWKRHPDSKKSLSRWFKALQKGDFENFNKLHAAFPTADKVGNYIVFNIGGNKLIASIHFNRGKIYIRNVFTHKEYEKGGWKK